MNTNRTVTLIVVGVLILSASKQSATASVFGTLGLGGGSSALWDIDSQGGIAVGGTVIYRWNGPSLSLRYAGVAALTPMFSTYEEDVSEIALMGGWDFFSRNATALGLRLGLGRLSYHGGYRNAGVWDYAGNGWGPALQFDAFWRRVGMSYIVHAGGIESYSAFLLCFRFGDIRSKQ
jgi:hypothetical protein